MLEDLFSKYANEDYLSYEIRINNNVPQVFVHRFNNGRTFKIYLTYNKSFSNWFFDVYENINNENVPIALGIQLQYGLDLFSHLKYKNIGEFYVFPKNIDYDYSPTYNNLNNSFIYIWRH